MAGAQQLCVSSDTFAACFPARSGVRDHRTMVSVTDDGGSQEHGQEGSGEEGRQASRTLRTPTIDDSVEGHVNLQPQNIEERPQQGCRP